MSGSVLFSGKNMGVFRHNKIGRFCLSRPRAHLREFLDRIFWAASPDSWAAASTRISRAKPCQAGLPRPKNAVAQKEQNKNGGSRLIRRRKTRLLRHGFFFPATALNNSPLLPKFSLIKNSFCEQQTRKKTFSPLSPSN